MHEAPTSLSRELNDMKQAGEPICLNILTDVLHHGGFARSLIRLRTIIAHGLKRNIKKIYSRKLILDITPKKDPLKDTRPREDVFASLESIGETGPASRRNGKLRGHWRRRQYPWWSICTLHLRACQMELPLAIQVFCCCVPSLSSATVSLCLLKEQANREQAKQALPNPYTVYL